MGGVIISVFAPSAIDRGFKPLSCQTKENKIDICCFNATNAGLRRKRKDWLIQNRDNVTKWSDMSTIGQIFSDLAPYKFNTACWF